MFAAAAMALSSLFVVANSLRLTLFRPRYAGSASITPSRAGDAVR